MGCGCKERNTQPSPRPLPTEPVVMIEEDKQEKTEQDEQSQETNES